MTEEIAPMKLSAEELISTGKIKPKTTGYGAELRWLYLDKDNIFTVAPDKEQAVRRANEILSLKLSKPIPIIEPVKPFIKPSIKEETKEFTFYKDDKKITVKDHEIERIKQLNLEGWKIRENGGNPMAEEKKLEYPMTEEKKLCKCGLATFGYADTTVIEVFFE